jgi:hypothetical protein
MVIKVSQLLERNFSLETDPSPTLGGPLNTNNFPIENGIGPIFSPVTISGNEYPITTGLAGQVLTSTGGLGPLFWSNVTGSGLNLYNENWTVGFIPPSASGTNSVAIGEGAQTSVKDSLALGLQSLTRIQGGVVQASGRFASTGDAQTGRYLVRNITTSSVPTTLFVDGVGGSVRLVLADMSTWTFKITVTGHRTDANDGHAGFEFSGVIYRQTGASTTTILNRVSENLLARSNNLWTVSVAADNINGALQIQVIGEIGKVIRWLAFVETVEITN